MDGRRQGGVVLPESLLYAQRCHLCHKAKGIKRTRTSGTAVGDITVLPLPFVWTLKCEGDEEEGEMGVGLTLPHLVGFCRPRRSDPLRICDWRDRCSRLSRLRICLAFSLSLYGVQNVTATSKRPRLSPLSFVFAFKRRMSSRRAASCAPH